MGLITKAGKRETPTIFDWYAPNLRELHVYREVSRPDKTIWDIDTHEEQQQIEQLGDNPGKASRHLRVLRDIHGMDAKDFFFPFWPRK